MICTKCNFQNEESAKFCKNCGSKLVDKPIKQPKPPKTKEDEEMLRTTISGKRKKLILAIIVVGTVLIVAVAGYFIFKNVSVNNSLIPVKTSNTWGYINLKGDYVVNSQFDNVGFFSEGLAKVRTADRKIGYIDKDGEFAVPAIYISGTTFSDGLAFVVSGGGYPICIDKKGNTKFEMKEAEYVHGFSNGLAMFIDINGKCGFVNKTGEIVINPQFERVEDFSEGKAAFYNGNKWGYVDKKGAYVINPKFDKTKPFNDGLAAVRQGDKWGYIDKKGTYVINPQFEHAESFENGLAVVQQGQLYGYINKKGQFRINPQFDEAQPFKNELAIVRQEQPYGYINKKGQFMINPQFGMALNFEGNIAAVMSANKIGFIDKKGKYIINPQFDNVKLFNDLRSHDNFITENYVKTNYYDATEFIKLFFEKDAGNSFDGIHASTTLINLSNNPIYGACANVVSEYNANCRKRIEITKDISISEVIFCFYDPIYSYNSYGQREYNYKVNIDAIEYKFNLEGKATGKGNAVVLALKNEIERRNGQQMELEGDKYFLFIDDDKPGFEIFNNDDNVQFIISLKAKKWDCGDKGSNVTATLRGGRLVIKGTGAMGDYNDGDCGYVPWRLHTITTAVIANGVTYIGSNAIWGAKSVIIGNSVNAINDFAFNGCMSIFVDAANTEYSSENGVLFKRKNTLVKYLSCEPAGTYTVPNSVTTIGNFAFYWRTDLTSVTIPNSVTTIGDGAFFTCRGLSSITIPNSITSIGRVAFYGCESLTSVTIPNSVTTISEMAFANCGLASITIPNSVVSIGKEAFASCRLTFITIPNSVTSIGKEAFANCGYLTSVTIGNSVTSIDDGAFWMCSSLSEIINKATTPQKINENVFLFISYQGWNQYDYQNQSRLTLRVPAESVNAYRNAEGWKDFGKIVAIDE